MKYFVTVDGEEHEIELVERLGHLFVSHGGEPISVDYQAVDDLGQVALFVGDTSYAVSIEGDLEHALVTIAGHVYHVDVEDERERAAHDAERERTGGATEVKGIMPGIVVETLVGEGDAVDKGQPLLILEAMKMQNEIVAPIRGVVAGLHVAQGQTVGTGALLATLLPPEEEGA